MSDKDPVALAREVLSSTAIAFCDVPRATLYDQIEALARAVLDLAAHLDELERWRNAYEHQFDQMREQRDTARAEVARLRGARKRALSEATWLFDAGHFDDGHMDDCPGDDSCECEWVLRINLLFAILQGNAEVEAKMRAALGEEGCPLCGETEPHEHEIVEEGSDAAVFQRKTPDDEHCAHCGKHIRHHFGGTEYRCAALGEEEK